MEHYVNEELEIFITESKYDNKYLVFWEDNYEGYGSDILTLDEVYDKYPWVQRQDVKNKIIDKGYNYKEK